MRSFYPLRWAFLLLILGTGLGAAPVSAQVQLRTLPADAKRATLGQPQPLPYVVLDGKLARLAPGGVIYDRDNRFILQNALPAGAAVAYTINPTGDIARIYILTARERAAFKPK